MAGETRRAQKERMMATGTKVGAAGRRGNAVGIWLDRNIHKGMRVVAAERGVPTNRVYNEVLGKFLLEVGAGRFVRGAEAK